MPRTGARRADTTGEEAGWQEAVASPGDPKAAVRAEGGPCVRNGPSGGEGGCLPETLRAEALIEAILLPTGSQCLWGDLVTIVVSFRILHHFTSGVGGLHAGGHKTGWGSQVPGPSSPCQGSLEGHLIKGAGSDPT